LSVAFRKPEALDEHLVAASRLEVDLLASEPGLMLTKWFDYRFLHPVAATKIFADAYVKAFRSAWARTQDLYEAESKDPL